MSEEQEPATVYYAAVPRPNEQPVLRPIAAVQKRARTDAAGLPLPEFSVLVEPTPQGVYIIDPLRYGDDFKTVCAVMDRKVKEWNKPKQPKRLVGPFTSIADAFKVVHAERPKTDSEKVEILSRQSADQSAENAALKQRIADLEKKTGAGK